MFDWIQITGRQIRINCRESLIALATVEMFCKRFTRDVMTRCLKMVGTNGLPSGLPSRSGQNLKAISQQRYPR